MAEGFESLVAWQKAHNLMLFVHRKIVPLFPTNEKWGLANQICRSSKSIGANIAESYGRFYYKDAIRFCYHARGSLCETQNHLIDAKDLGYIPAPLYDECRNMADEANRLLNGYINYLKRQKPGNTEPGHDINIDSLHYHATNPTPDP